MNLGPVMRVALLGLVLVSILPTISYADDLMARLKEKPADCQIILGRTVAHFVKIRANKESETEINAADVKKRAVRLVAAQIDRIESEVLKLYERRDELQSQSPVNPRAIAIAQRRIDATLTPEALSLYRSKIRAWKAIQSEIERTSEFEIDMMITDEIHNLHVSPPRERAFRPRWVLKWAAVGSLSLPILGAGVVPGASQVLKWTASTAENHEITWARSLLPDEANIPNFGEAAARVYNQGLVPASEATWNAYGSQVEEFFRSQISQAK